MERAVQRGTCLLNVLIPLLLRCRRPQRAHHAPLAWLAWTPLLCDMHQSSMEVLGQAVAGAPADPPRPQRSPLAERAAELLHKRCKVGAF